MTPTESVKRGLKFNPMGDSYQLYGCISEGLERRGHFLCCRHGRKVNVLTINCGRVTVFTRHNDPNEAFGTVCCAKTHVVFVFPSLDVSPSLSPTSTCWRLMSPR